MEEGLPGSSWIKENTVVGVEFRIGKHQVDSDGKRTGRFKGKIGTFSILAKDIPAELLSALQKFVDDSTA
jgi:hypothetical protein